MNNKRDQNDTLFRTISQRLSKVFGKLSGLQIQSKEIETGVTATYQQIVAAAQLSADDLMDNLETSENGLSAPQVTKRQGEFGMNIVTHEKSLPWYRQFLQAFMDPFIGVLIILAIASLFSEYIFVPSNERSLISVLIIAILVLLSVLLNFIQEFQAGQAADKLMKLVKSKALVYRQETGLQEFSTEEIVPGDILHLSAGDIIPADTRLFDINNLSVNEAALTGESLPVDKFELVNTDLEYRITDKLKLSEIDPLDFDNIGYQGTNVVSGFSKAIVIATGNRTILGSMSERLIGHNPPSSFDEGVKSVSKLLIKFMLVMVPVIFFVNGLVQGNWLQALLFALAVAVGLTPEMLPTIVTANLAKGSLEMAKHKTVVKKLNAIQNLGAMDVLCTDKTGTLTHDSVVLQACVNIDGEEDSFALKYATLNSFFQSGLRNPLDNAVLNYHDETSLEAIVGGFEKIGEIPFETARRRMSIIVRSPRGKHKLICKGAVDELLAVSTKVHINNEIQPLSSTLKKKIKALSTELVQDGLRILLVSYKVEDGIKSDYQPEDENDLILSGLVGFLDPPKESAGEAIKALQSKGIRVVVITGDNEIATRRVCKEIGFKITGLADGPSIEKMSDSMLGKMVESVNVFVRTTPLQKSRILNLIKENGHTVGFLGDGINDSIALRDADVGITVENVVDIARESAEILLLEKSLMVLEEGVAQGRVVFGNIMKYIKMTVSSNFGNVFSVLIASLVLPFPPMLPLHLLIQNLLYDISQLSIPWDYVDEEFLAKPRKWDPKSIVRFTLIIGPISSLFDLTTFALLWYVLGANSVEFQSLFHSGWFVLGLVSQTLVIHLIRTRKIPFIQSTASKPVLLMTFLIVLIGILIPFTKFGTSIGFAPLPAAYFPWLVATLLAYGVVVQLVKVWFIRRFDTWL